jgi:hypothetical protein
MRETDTPSPMGRGSEVAFVVEAVLQPVRRMTTTSKRMLVAESHFFMNPPFKIRPHSTSYLKNAVVTTFLTPSVRTGAVVRAAVKTATTSVFETGSTTKFLARY